MASAVSLRCAGGSAIRISSHPPALGFAIACALAGSAAALAVLASGLIGAFHAGVEYGWWEGFTRCTSMVEKGSDPLAAVLAAPITRCDEIQWSLFGISLAGFNFLISTAGALAALVLLGRRK
jgi:disulfide bond formation protein DsbB